MSNPPEGSGGRPDRHLSAMSVGTTDATFLRKSLHHSAPAWVKPGSLFFITLCCEQRTENQLCRPEIGPALLDAVRFYHDHQRWFARLFLLMPDHAHALVAFPANEKMGEVLRNWKSFTARQNGIQWQRNFFEHRLRDGEQWELKADYIRQNPVRRGLIADARRWPYLIEN